MNISLIEPLSVGDFRAESQGLSRVGEELKSACLGYLEAAAFPHFLSGLGWLSLERPRANAKLS